MENPAGAGQCKLLAGDASDDDGLGWRVAVEGDTALVSAMFADVIGVDSGALYAFEHVVGEGWVETQKLVATDMAAGDQFFDKEDYHFPKPLVEVAGQPMIKLVIDNLRAATPDAEFIFVVNEQDCQHHSLDKVLDLMTDGQCKIVKLRQC